MIRAGRPRTYVYIDASNLFYGGDRVLGWSVDYKKLHEYLKKRYNAKKIMYFGGVETHFYEHNYIADSTVNLVELIKYLRKEKTVKLRSARKENERNIKLEKYIARAKFYKKLRDFGYQLILKPVKVYKNSDGSKRLKANCDLDMAMAIINDIPKYDRALVVTGDGDFLPVLKQVKHAKKEVLILAIGARTAAEIKRFAGNKFLDFTYLKFLVGMNLKRRKKNK